MKHHVNSDRCALETDVSLVSGFRKFLKVGLESTAEGARVFSERTEHLCDQQAGAGRFT